MPKAVWNGTTIAESEETIVVEANHYFPRESVRGEYLHESDTHTTCPWKGVAMYYDVVADGAVASEAAWYYPKASEAAKTIEGRIAFWKGVKVM